MKVTRFGKDRYMLSIDRDVTPHQFERIQNEWKDWWDAGADPSRPVVIAGEPVEFVDFISTEERLDEIAEKLDRLLDMLS